LGGPRHVALFQTDDVGRRDELFGPVLLGQAPHNFGNEVRRLSPESAAEQMDEHRQTKGGDNEPTSSWHSVGGDHLIAQLYPAGRRIGLSV
jgi:hypothetical protein